MGFTDKLYFDIGKVKKMEKKDIKEIEIIFEEVTEEEAFAGYTAGCSNAQSACCTRTCSRKRGCFDYDGNNEEEWGKFLEVQGGVIQY